MRPCVILLRKSFQFDFGPRRRTISPSILAGLVSATTQSRQLLAFAGSTRFISSSVQFWTEIAGIQADVGKFKNMKDTATTTRTEDDFPFPVKRIRFTTCSDLYLTQYFESGGKKKSPAGGISFDVGYIDTGYPKDVHHSFPTVLCVHGAAGNHKDLAGTIKTLSAQGARVLCPNFPGVGYTKMDRDFHYSHTTIENCNFLLDFLKALDVNRLDLIVAFSAGCYSAVPLAVKTGFPIRGLALLQVSGCRPYKGMRPFWLLKTVVKSMKRPIVRKMLNPISYGIMKFITGWKHIPSIDHPYIMGLVATGVPFDSYQKVSAELPFQQLPLLLTFSEDDKFMDAEISYEYADLVGLSKERLTMFDASGSITRRGAPIMERDRFLKGLVFQKGGHYAQRREPTATLLNEAVLEIYNHIRREAELDREQYNSQLLNR